MGNLPIVAPAIAGALLFYLGSPGQRWLRAPWPARSTRVAAAVCVALSAVCAVRALQPATSLAVVATTLMASLTAWPFLGALLERRRARRVAQ
ncbi:hypothetical protein BTH42_07130 [Burkholderia sp. SRS-W-2-2016]|uniref:hypothetical protein n=1 Tax=Burkholderia sp. SRS-W-2-2016 TaxID=1926878 RepID=UPI00094AF796|nr:hypothetical protein [Burkholderia sp. SRS-W-2-2016]OLL32218.1 hypothetical protein BTH42_07130 [Burkholderia sp. SRS-W-2-2016]